MFKKKEIYEIETRVKRGWGGNYLSKLGYDISINVIIYFFSMSKYDIDLYFQNFESISEHNYKNITKGESGQWWVACGRW